MLHNRSFPKEPRKHQPLSRTRFLSIESCSICDYYYCVWTWFVLIRRPIWTPFDGHHDFWTPNWCHNDNNNFRTLRTIQICNRFCERKLLCICCLHNINSWHNWCCNCSTLSPGGPPDWTGLDRHNTDIWVKLVFPKNGRLRRWCTQIMISHPNGNNQKSKSALDTAWGPRYEKSWIRTYIVGDMGEKMLPKKLSYLEPQAVSQS